MAQYLKLFKTEADYEAVVGTENEPQLSHIIEDVEIKKKINTNGHCYVDLGLPSGTLWACYNVGSSTETGYGNFYKYGQGANVYNKNQADYTGVETPLASSADTATQVMGGDWHMPLSGQCQELIDNTNHEWVFSMNGTGVNGVKFISKKDPSKYIFIPASGNYYNGRLVCRGTHCNVWASTSWNTTNAYYFHAINQSSSPDLNPNSIKVWSTSRYFGYSVRGVIG